MPRAECLTLAPGSDRILVELFQILKDDAVESAALNMQYAGSRHSEASSTDFLVSLQTSLKYVSPGKARLAKYGRVGAPILVTLWLYLFAYLYLSLNSIVLDGS